MMPAITSSSLIIIPTGAVGQPTDLAVPLPRVARSNAPATR